MRERRTLSMYLHEPMSELAANPCAEQLKRILPFFDPDVAFP
jgi:hypothetical protein